MAVYTELQGEEIGEFLKGYSLGQLVRAHGIAEGVENTNYIVVTQKDHEETRYILTIYEKRVDEKDLPFFLGLMEKLAHADLPVPRPMHRNDGELVARLKGKPAAMVSFLEGSSCKTSIRNEHLALLGEAQARMHLGAESFALPRPNTLSLAGWKHLYEKIENRLNEIAPGLKAALAAELEYLSIHWPKGLPSGVIHADLFPDNVFFDGNKLSGIIDFYFACHDFLMYDLVISMNAWCFEKYDFNVTKARHLLTAYNNIRPISGAELNALPILARGAALRFLLTRAHDWLHRTPGALVTPKDPMEYIKKLRFHQSVKHHDEYGL